MRGEGGYYEDYVHKLIWARLSVKWAGFTLLLLPPLFPRRGETFGQNAFFGLKKGQACTTDIKPIPVTIGIKRPRLIFCCLGKKYSSHRLFHPRDNIRILLYRKCNFKMNRIFPVFNLLKKNYNGLHWLSTLKNTLQEKPGLPRKFSSEKDELISWQAIPKPKKHQIRRSMEFMKFGKVSPLWSSIKIVKRSVGSRSTTWAPAASFIESTLALFFYLRIFFNVVQCSLSLSVNTRKGKPTQHLTR